MLKMLDRFRIKDPRGLCLLEVFGSLRYERTDSISVGFMLDLIERILIPDIRKGSVL
jgi:hypothetical protein